MGLVSVLLVLSLFGACFAVPCPVADVGKVSATCMNNSFLTPYCVEAGNGTNCQACRSDCDCPFDRYCSVAPNTFGSCELYHPSGSGRCVAMTDAELLDPALPINWKCARLWTDASTGTLRIDWKGFCNGFVCFPCNSGANPAAWSTAPSPCPAAFNGPRRVCIAPGVFVNADNLPWNVEVFLMNPQAVWLALIWTAIIVLGFFYIFFSISGRRQAAMRAASRV